MTNKAKLGIVALLACCSMVGMGFASWTISQGPSAGFSAEVTGTVSAENVVTSDQFITVLGTPTGLAYTSEGFTSGVEGEPYTGTLTVSFQVNVAACKPVLGDSSNFAITIKLNKEEGITNLFAASSGVTVNASEENITVTFDEEGAPGNVLTVNSPKQNNNSYVISGKLDYAAAHVVAVLTVTYTFKFDSTTSFTDYFYKPFTENSDLAFLFGASLTGGGN